MSFYSGVEVIFSIVMVDHFTISLYLDTISYRGGPDELLFEKNINYSQWALIHEKMVNPADVVIQKN